MSDEKGILTQQVRLIVSRILESVESDPQFDNDESLVLSRRISSLQVVEMATLLEQQFQLDFARVGFDQYAFDSVNAIVALLQNES
jgi:acyl carrier protein